MRNVLAGLDRVADHRYGTSEALWLSGCKNAFQFR